jgi:hypothetical protein
MDSAITRLPHFCQMPAMTGAPLCAKPATQFITLKRADSQKTVAACDECAAYIEKEARFYAKPANRSASKQD